MTNFMDADQSRDYLNKHASKIATIINDNSPDAMDFLRVKLDQWLSLPDRESIFPITDNDFGEPIDNTITFDQACVMISAIHDKHCPRSEKIGQYGDDLVDDSGELLPDYKKSIAYQALLASVPETLSLDDTEVLEYHSNIVEKSLVTEKIKIPDAKKKVKFVVSPKRNSSKGGRPRLPREVIEFSFYIVKAWAEARERGVRKAEFVADWNRMSTKKIQIKDVDNALRRCNREKII